MHCGFSAGAVELLHRGPPRGQPRRWWPRGLLHHSRWAHAGGTSRASRI